MKLSFRKAKSTDREVLEGIRSQSFEPIFASFQNILGEEIYELAQRREDEEQKNILAEMFLEESTWQLYVVEQECEIVGFISFQLNEQTTVGEIGLNAVRPVHSGKNVGTRMYKFANEQMRKAGMRVATVATGGDDSHIPARRAYEKAGFNVQIPSVWYCRTL